MDARINPSILSSVLGCVGGKKVFFAVERERVRVRSQGKSFIDISLPRSTLPLGETRPFSIARKELLSLLEECKQVCDIEFDVDLRVASLAVESILGRYTITKRCGIEECFLTEAESVSEPCLEIGMDVSTLKIVGEMKYCEEVSLQANQEGVLIIECWGEMDRTITHKMLNNPRVHGGDRGRLYEVSLPYESLSPLLALAKLDPESVIMSVHSPTTLLFSLSFPGIRMGVRVT
jgi:hypothetical protein